MKNIMPVLAAMLAVAGMFAFVTAVTQPVHADADSSGPLRAEMYLASAKKFAPGEPVLVHYKVINTSPSESTTVSVGDNGTEWYSIKVLDATGRSVQMPPRLFARARKPEGLYQSPERILLPGEYLEGDIVASRFMSVPVPGQYSLHIAVLLGYETGQDSAGAPPEGMSNHFSLIRDFVFTTTVTRGDLTVVRARAESLRQEMLQGNKDSNTLAEELFSMPEATALPTWQSLVNDPMSSEFVLAGAAQQLSFRPSKAKADLVAQILWDSGRDPKTRSSAQAARIWAAMSKMYGTSDSSLKQYIRSLYIAHGVSASELDGSSVKSHPN